MKIEVKHLPGEGAEKLVKNPLKPGHLTYIPF